MKFKNSPFVLATVFAFSLLLVAACGGKDPACATDNMSYVNNIVPVLKANGCMASSCHAAGTTGATDSYATYAEFKAVVDAKRVLGAIKHEAGFSKMPKNAAQIDACDISQIEAWINQGAKDN